MLSELSIHNYKSLRNIKLSNLPDFVVLVGANAAGKSNFSDALDFLSLVFRTGLAGAVRAKGGYENICFRRARRSRGSLAFGIVATTTEQVQWSDDEEMQIYCTFHYNFAFRAATEAIASEYEVISETARVEISCEKLDQPNVLMIERNSDRTHTVTGEVSEELQEAREMLIPPLDRLQEFVKLFEVPQDELLIARDFGRFPPFSWLHDILVRCRVYQISPYVARETGIPERSPELGRHGENLPAAVEYLKRAHPQAFEELLDHLSHTVPTMEELVTDYVETKQLGLFFKERSVGRRWFAQDVSDGTIQTVSIFLPLVDPRNRILVIEEPENSLHPWILRHFIDSCKNHSAEKQIFVTTQSLVAVNEVPLESLYVVRRRQSETSIDRCIVSNPELRRVISDQLMGLGEYWDTGAVAGVPEYGEQLQLFED